MSTSSSTTITKISLANHLLYTSKNVFLSHAELSSPKPVTLAGIRESLSRNICMRPFAFSDENPCSTNDSSVTNPSATRESKFILFKSNIHLLRKYGRPSLLHLFLIRGLNKCSMHRMPWGTALWSKLCAQDDNSLIFSKYSTETSCGIRKWMSVLGNSASLKNLDWISPKSSWVALVLGFAPQNAWSPAVRRCWPSCTWIMILVMYAQFSWMNRRKKRLTL